MSNSIDKSTSGRYDGESYTEVSYKDEVRKPSKPKTSSSYNRKQNLARCFNFDDKQKRKSVTLSEFPTSVRHLPQKSSGSIYAELEIDDPVKVRNLCHAIKIACSLGTKIFCFIYVFLFYSK
jgi:hypothetical protein